MNSDRIPTDFLPRPASMRVCEPQLMLPVHTNKTDIFSYKTITYVIFGGPRIGQKPAIEPDEINDLRIHSYRIGRMDARHRLRLRTSQPHATDATLRVMPRYPAAPWNWNTLSPDFVLPAAAVSVEGSDATDDLRELADKRGAEAKKAQAIARDAATGRQQVAHMILSTPAAVPGDACASAQVRVDAWLRGRVSRWASGTRSA